MGAIFTDSAAATLTGPVSFELPAVELTAGSNLSQVAYAIAAHFMAHPDTTVFPNDVAHHANLTARAGVMDASRMPVMQTAEANAQSGGRPTPSQGRTV